MVIDRDIFYFINSFAGRWQWLDWLGIFCAVYVGYILLLCLAFFLLKDTKKYWPMVWQAMLAGLGARLLVEIFYWSRFRFRPFIDDNNHLLIPYDAYHSSFPSAHASFYFTISTIVYFYNKKIGILFYIASALIALGRVFVGVHWPSDIVVGALLGMLTGWGLNKLFKKISHNET